MKATIDLPIRSGDLRQRVRYQTPVYNSPADAIESWTDFATVWAAVEPTDIQSDEDYKSDKQTAIQYVIIRHRYLSGLNTTMRAIHGSTTYDVRAVADVRSRNRQHFVTCRIVQ